MKQLSDHEYVVSEQFDKQIVSYTGSLYIYIYMCRFLFVHSMYHLYFAY